MSYNHLKDIFSEKRLEKYLNWAAQDKVKAMQLYALNTSISESFYISLQTLEIALRNRIHNILTEKFSDENWFFKLQLDGSHWPDSRIAGAVSTAIHTLKSRHKTENFFEPNAGQIIAELNFGFWTGFFNKQYETLWQQTLFQLVSPDYRSGMTRKKISGKLTKIRLLRNRIAHYEPILNFTPHPTEAGERAFGLREMHEIIIELLKFISEDAAKWCADNSRFQNVFPQNGVSLAI